MSAIVRAQALIGRLGNGHFAVADQMALVGGNFLMNLLLARNGAIDAFGTFSVLYALLILVNAGQSALISEPLGLTREQDGGRSPVAPDGQVANLKIFLPVSVLVAGYAWATLPGLGLGHAVLFAAGCAIASASWSARGRLHALGKHRQGFHVSLAGAVVMATTTALGILFLDAISTGLLAIVLAASTSLLLALQADDQRRAHPPLSLATVVELGKSGLPIAMAVWVANNIVFLMLGQQQRLPDAAGLRGVLTLLLPINQIMIGSAAFLLPRLAVLARAGQHEQIARVTRLTLVASVGASLAFGITAYLCAGLVSRLLLGPQFDAYIGALRLVAVFLPASWCCVTVIRVHFQGSRRPRYVLLAYGLALAVGVPIAWRILGMQHASAAALATLVIHGTLAVLMAGMFVLTERERSKRPAHESRAG
jgi:hypothetical protein